MAKKLGKFLAFAVAAGAAAAGTYYYLQNKKAKEDWFEDDDFDDDFEDEDFQDEDFEDDFDENDFLDESEDEEAEDDIPVFTKGTNEQGHTYVTLDIKAAQDKATQLYDNVANKVGEAVSKLKSSSEYETVSGKLSDTVNKIKNSEEFQAVDEHLENALNKVREATEKAVGSVSEKLDSDAAQQAADTINAAVKETADVVKDMSE